MLGWHHCRYGYRDIDHVQWAIDGYKEANIPCKFFLATTQLVIVKGTRRINSNGCVHQQWKLPGLTLITWIE